MLAKLSAVVAMITATLITLPVKAHATAIATAGKVKGWDLYGRVPHDDWLFTNWRLTDPNLLKRSLAECIRSELPDVLDNFRRRKRINEIAAVCRGVGYFVLAFVFVAVMYKGAMQASLRRMEREDREKRGFAPPVSAVPKTGGRKGTDIDGTDGWIDMESSDDDDDKGKGDDDADDDEGVGNKK